MTRAIWIRGSYLRGVLYENFRVFGHRKYVEDVDLEAEEVVGLSFFVAFAKLYLVLEELVLVGVSQSDLEKSYWKVAIQAVEIMRQVVRIGSVLFGVFVQLEGVLADRGLPA